MKLALALAAACCLTLPAAALAKDRTVDCEGGGKRCTATFPLSGVKTGDRLVARLSDTDLELRSIKPSSPSLRADYGFAGFSERLGGSEFVAKLLVLDRMPRRARITFTFAVPPRMRACGDLRFRTAGATIRLGDVEVHGVSCARGRRLAKRCVSGEGPGTRWTVFDVDRGITLQRRGRRVAFELLNVRESCAPSG